MKNRSGALIIWGVAILVAAWGAWLILAEDDAGRSGRGFGGGATSVRVETVQLEPFADVIEAIGTAKANESVVLTARVSETVGSVNFEDGAHVEEGTVLLELTNIEERAMLAEAEATLREAESQYARIMELQRQGSAPETLVDQRLRILEESRERLNASRARLNDRIIRAPFAGILGLRSVSQGTLVAPGTEITTIDDVHIIKLDFSVPERFIGVLRPGVAITAYSAAYPNRPFTGEVKTISSRVDPVTRAVTVRAEIPNQDRALHPGMLLTLTLKSNERVSLAIPITALIPVGRENFVFVKADDDTVTRRSIELGTRTEERVEVTSGLVAGDVVVSSGLVRLRDGVKVRVIDDQNAEEPAPNTQPQ